MAVTSTGASATGAAQERRFLALCAKQPQATTALCECAAQTIREEFSGDQREMVFGYWAEATEKGPDKPEVEDLLRRLADREGQEFRHRFARSAIKSLSCNQK